MTITCNACDGRCQYWRRDTYKPVIAIAGLLSYETSTFTNARTALSAFNPLRDDDIVNEHSFLHQGTGLGDAAKWRGALTAYALPGGMVKRDAFENLAEEIISRLEKIVKGTPLDGLWYDIHGAMFVEGLEDCDAELLRRIRNVVGWEVAISASLDMHGNVSRNLVEHTDLITCYRSAPHEDVDETKERACRNLVDLIQDRRRYREETTLEAPWPTKVWIRIPILLPGEQTSTRQEPAKSIYAEVCRITTRSWIADAAAWVGYAWSDEPRSHATVVATGWRKCAVVKGAERIAELFWERRKEFHFAVPAASFHDCFKQSQKSDARPYFISDSGDNPTADSSGDMTWTLRRLVSLLEHRKTAASESNFIYASIPSPTAVARTVEAGIDAHVAVTVDAGVDDDISDPINLAGTVQAIKHGDEAAETEIVFKLAGLPVSIIFTKLRKPYHFEHDFADLGLNIGKEGSNAIVIVKIGYLEPELYALAKDWMLALTPGGVDQDLPRLGHRKIERPMWPLDTEFGGRPDLTAQIVERPCHD